MKLPSPALLVFDLFTSDYFRYNDFMRDAFLAESIFDW